MPFDSKSPFITSGIRIGTAALTTRGMHESEMRTIAGFIDRVLSDPDSFEVRRKIRTAVSELCDQYPLYQTINL